MNRRRLLKCTIGALFVPKLLIDAATPSDETFPIVLDDRYQLSFVKEESLGVQSAGLPWDHPDATPLADTKATVHQIFINGDSIWKKTP